MKIRYFFYFMVAIFILSTAYATKTVNNKKTFKINHLRHLALAKNIRSKSLHAKTVKSGTFTSRAATMMTASTIYGLLHLSKELNAIINSDDSRADIAVYVKSMHTGELLYARNINKLLTPASTLKIMTAEAALIFLGAEYRFATQLLTDTATVKKGVLQGNLYIILNGDPSLTYYDLVELFVNLRSQQIRSISGNVYIDDSAYDKNLYGPGWDVKDKEYCYAAPISASIINHNCLSFQVVPSKSGRIAEVVTSPRFFYPTIKNTVLTKTAKMQTCSVHFSYNPSSMIAIDGCMARGNFASGMSYVVTDIHEYNRALFKSILDRLGVNVNGKVLFGRAPDNLSLIGQHTSQPLRLLINEMLKKSDNIIASALFKKLGQLYMNQPGSWINGGIAVSQILTKAAHLNSSGLKILDGSGLSAYNLISPTQLMQILEFAFHHYPTSYEFISALPIAGVDGTLKHRMLNIAHKVRAKTGTISGVVSLAGYTVSADKEPLAFVIMINGSKGMAWQYKGIEDRIATALTRFKRMDNRIFSTSWGSDD